MLTPTAVFISTCLHAYGEVAKIRNGHLAVPIYTIADDRTLTPDVFTTQSS